MELIHRGELPALYAHDPAHNKLERSLQRRLSRELAGFAGRLLDGITDQTISAGNEGAIFAALSDDVATATAGVQGAFEDSFTAGARQAFEKETLSILEQGGQELQWGQVQAEAKTLLETRSFQASKRLMDRVTGNIQKTLLTGFDEGLSVPDIGKSLKAVVRDLRTSEAEVIARTEMNSAGNTGNFIAQKAAQVQYKQWLTAEDGRVRTSHMLQHGMVVGIDENFPNGLAHPGDSSGRLEEFINCRCAGTAYFPLPGEATKSTPYTGRA